MNHRDTDLAILMMYYTFSDQYGEVNMPSVKAWAKTHLAMVIDDDYFYVEQEHLNILMDAGAIPDIRPMLAPFVKL